MIILDRSKTTFPGAEGGGEGLVLCVSTETKPTAGQKWMLLEVDSGKFFRWYDGSWMECTTQAAWGNVVGTLADQLDLQAVLNAKATSGHDHNAAYDAIGTAAAALATALAADFSGDYVDLTNKPTLGDAAAKNTGTAPGTVAAGDHTHPGGAASWGGIGGTLADQTDLQAALDGKQVAGSYEAANANIQAHIGSSANPHSVTKAQVGLGNVDNTSDAAKPVSTATQTALNGKEPANSNIQAHVAQEHAPANAQKNSDILKAEIEAKLTGEITSHTHPAGVGGADPWTYLRLPADCTISTAAAGDVTNGGVLFGFTPAANTNYIWEAVLGIRSATATVNPRLGFAWATGMTDGVCSIEQTSTATAKVMANGNIAASLLVAVGGIPTNTTSWPAICYGSVRAGATPSGNCRMQLATETANTVVRVVAAVSYFRYRALA